MAVDVSGSMLARFEAQPNGGIKRVWLILSKKDLMIEWTCRLRF
jgi:hypothetical protein